MLRLHPVARLLAVLLISAAALLGGSLNGLAPAVIVVIIAVSISGAATSFLRFVGIAAAPILLALCLVWGYFMPPGNVPAPHGTGVQYAIFLWLRVVICGGAFQFLFVPLLAHPAHMKDFLDRTGSRGSLGTLIMSSIVFIPETVRRLRQVIDARRAQGRKLSGLSGLREVPALLMPLVASLLDSSVKRAELWAHRGVLVRQDRLGLEGADYSYGQGLAAIATALGAFTAGVLA
jgi:energy-coupling factor transporter transmembrane protein EcfT